ncbi:glucose-6-phosphate dehydrogenase assembly protein OpcA [Blastococcus sp. TF02A-26]|uniref:glucose-6-phosphate dehydrogenase assembly protein OpcA n=1 Tax=Blastococcus sp. TF02A-26 TaxID=2250577 RepID=UPI000DE97F56|nr:glucose-6-phosphate dehydrogenase assembly protein OpcA [Blastococcus sp. TF02A-26]RBY90675.1 glucose-6-phosphate dehydrogenase [Blastococcus sp. TF02A-26]
MTTLWDTTGSAVVKELAAQRRTGGAVLSGVALTLVVVADEDRVAEAEEAATAAAEQHPCRILLVVRRQIEAPVPRLDAEVLIGGRLGPGEAVVMRMYGRLALHAESVVLPLLAADAPVVAWWHAPAPERLQTDALAVIADRRITDSSIAEDHLAALRTRANDYAPGDTDLAWTRTTAWRSALASTLDAVSGRRGDSVRVQGGRVEGDPGNASARLLAGWLTSRCGCEVEVVEGDRRPGPSGVGAVLLQLDQDEEVTVRADRHGGALLTQPYRPDTKVALPDRPLGDLLGEELRRLDPDEPYAEALEAATGVQGLAARSAEREHVWFDPARPDDGDDRRRTEGDGAAADAPTVPGDSVGTDDVALNGERNADEPADPSAPVA